MDQGRCEERHEVMICQDRSMKCKGETNVENDR